MRLSQDAIRRMVGNGNGIVGGGGGGGDDISGVTQAWVSQNFVSIDFFTKLFKAYDSETTPNEVRPNDMQSTITNIKAMFGLWTEQYLSALGLNSSGGSGGATSLVDLLDVNISNPTNGQALVYNSTTQKWENQNVSGGGGTVTQIYTGTGLTGGPITTSGAIAIDSTYQGYIQHGETAYGWGDHRQAGYATPISVANQMENYAYISSGVITIGTNSITPLTQHQVVDGTFWGQPWTNSGSVRGSIDAGSNGGQITGFHLIELNNNGTLSGYGGFIDFHFNGSSSDYTSRIIEDASGRLFFDVSVGVRIGSALLSWDNTNNALKIQKIDGTAANFYATGGVSALGMSAGASSIDAMTFGYVTINNEIDFSDNYVIKVNNDDMYIGDSNNDAYVRFSDMCSWDGTDKWKIETNGHARFARLYLDATRYLFVDSGILYYYNGSTNKQIAFTN